MDPEPSPAGTPSAKKMKQARLPFKILSTKPLPENVAVHSEPKKRKLSEGAAGPQKPPKTPKSSEKVTRVPSRTDATENEVSSSSEAEQAIVIVEDENHCPSEEAAVPKSSKTGLMDKYVKVTPTQKAEVSTSGVDEVVDLTESNEAEAISDAEPCSPRTVEGSLEENDDEVGSPQRQVSSGHSPLMSPSNEATVEGDSAIEEASTPVSTKRTRAKTPGSAKEKEEARRKLREEKERLKAEKQRQREEAKAERERLRQEEKERKEAERLEAKQKREKEKQEKMEQQLKEKEEKQRLREEERRKKQEMMEAKNEEKRRKEEERAKEEEEKNLKKEKQKAFFSTFFTQVEKPAAKATEAPVAGPFMAFEVKKDMRLAPSAGAQRTIADERLKALDSSMERQDADALYLRELKQRRKSKLIGKEGKTWPLEESEEMEVVDPKSSRCKMSAKFLHFHENYRPAYYGTWRKTSLKLNPRNPFAKDQDLFDYEVDSDDEWEEEEPGESLSHSEGEGDDSDADNGDEEDEDGFFVPHGYLSEGEGGESDEEEMSPEKLKARQAAKARAWELEMGRRCELLRPVCLGCLWWPLQDSGPKENPALEILSRFKAVLIDHLVPIPLDPPAKSSTHQVCAESGKKKTKARGVPEEALPDLIKLVHGNSCSLQKLIREFREFWKLKTSSAPNESTGSETANASEDDFLISKRQLTAKIREIARYSSSDVRCWFVSDSVRAEHGLSDLPIPTEWQWLTRRTPKKQPRDAIADQSPASNPGSSKKLPSNVISIEKFTVSRDSPDFVSPPPPICKSVKSKEGTPSIKRLFETALSTQTNDQTQVICPSAGSEPAAYREPKVSPLERMIKKLEKNHQGKERNAPPDGGSAECHMEID